MKQPEGPRPPVVSGSRGRLWELRNELEWDLYDLSLFLLREWADWETKLIRLGDRLLGRGGRR